MKPPVISWEDCKDCGTKESVEVKIVLVPKDFTTKKTWLCRRCGSKTVKYPERITMAKTGVDCLAKIL